MRTIFFLVIHAVVVSCISAAAFALSVARADDRYSYRINVSPAPAFRSPERAEIALKLLKAGSVEAAAREINCVLGEGTGLLLNPTTSTTYVRIVALDGTDAGCEGYVMRQMITRTDAVTGEKQKLVGR